MKSLSYLIPNRIAFIMVNVYNYVVYSYVYSTNARCWDKMHLDVSFKMLLLFESNTNQTILHILWIVYAYLCSMYARMVVLVDNTIHSIHLLTLPYTIHSIQFISICSSNSSFFLFFSILSKHPHPHTPHTKTTQKPLRYGWLKWQLPCLFSLIFLFLFLALSLRFWPTSVVFMCRRRCWV